MGNKVAWLKHELYDGVILEQAYILCPYLHFPAFFCLVVVNRLQEKPVRKAASTIGGQLRSRKLSLGITD